MVEEALDKKINGRRAYVSSYKRFSLRTAAIVSTTQTSIDNGEASLSGVNDEEAGKGIIEVMQLDRAHAGDTGILVGVLDDAVLSYSLIEVAVFMAGTLLDWAIGVTATES